MKTRFAILVFISFAGILAYISFKKIKEPVPGTIIQKQSLPAPKSSPATTSPPPGITVPDPREDRSAKLMSKYASELSTIHEDLEAFWHAYEIFQTTIKPNGQTSPGSNREVMAILFGKNPRGIRFINPSKPYINRQGELLDRWQTPLFFHFVETNEIGIRSAGPDQTMWTNDDITFNEHGEQL